MTPDQATKLGQRLRNRKYAPFNPKQADEKPKHKRKVRAFHGRRVITVNRAKTLTAEQFENVLTEVGAGLNSERNIAILMLSFYCGLRAKEIAMLQWERNVLNSAGDIDRTVFVTHDVGKVRKERARASKIVERKVPLHPRAQAALRKLHALRPDDQFVAYPCYEIGANKAENSQSRHLLGQSSPNTLTQWLRRLYRKHGLKGCTGHSGRRTFITNTARRCNEIGASLNDVRELAGHRSLDTTQNYIEESPHRDNLVNLVF